MIWVTELWRDQAAPDAALANLAHDPAGREAIAEVRSRVQSWEMIELDFAGGKGPAVQWPVTAGQAIDFETAAPIAEETSRCVRPRCAN